MIRSHISSAITGWNHHLLVSIIILGGLSHLEGVVLHSLLELLEVQPTQRLHNTACLKPSRWWAACADGLQQGPLLLESFSKRVPRGEAVKHAHFQTQSLQAVPLVWLVRRRCAPAPRRGTAPCTPPAQGPRTGWPQEMAPSHRTGGPSLARLVTTGNVSCNRLGLGARLHYPYFKISFCMVCLAAGLSRQATRKQQQHTAGLVWQDASPVMQPCDALQAIKEREIAYQH